MTMAVLMYKALFYAIIQGCLCTSCDNGIDPCYLYNSIDIPYLSSRDPGTEFSHATLDRSYCDKYALDMYTWYRSDYNITTECVIQMRCGTNHPIWINGSIPGSNDGIVSRTGCLRTYTDCCGYTYPVMMKNCAYYTVYCFPEVPLSCHQRFCFDVGFVETTTTTAIPSTSTQVVNSNISNDENDGSNVWVAAAITFGGCTALFTIILTIVVNVVKRKVHPLKENDKQCLYCHGSKSDTDRWTRPYPGDELPPKI